MSDSTVAGVATWTTICFVATFCVTLYFTLYFARPGTPLLALFFTFVAWLASFSICYLVPIDLLQQTTDAAASLDQVWSALFWISFVLMWIIIPFFSGYFDNGDFTIKKKIRASLRFNAILVGSVLTIAGIGIIYLLAAQKKSMSDVAGYAMMASNLWGLIMLVFLAGYGLIAIPRELYHRSNLVRMRDETLYYVASLQHEWVEVKDEAKAIFRLVESWDGRVQQAAVANPEFQNYYQQICTSMIPTQLELQDERGNPADMPIIDELNALTTVDYKALVRLNYVLITTLRHYDMISSQKADCISRAISYDVAVGGQHENAPPPQLGQCRRLWWYLTVGFRRQFFLGLAIFCGLLSFSILFAEVTIPTHEDISPLLLIVRASFSNPLSEQIFTVIPIGYLSMCAYYPTYKIRLSKIYYISKHRTDENSLLLNATLILRVSVPLAYNFVLLLQLPSSSLQSFTGVISTIPFFGTSLNDWFGVIMAIVSLLTLIRITDYLLRVLGREQFEFRQAGNDESETAELIQEGRIIVNDSRRKQELQLQRVGNSHNISNSTRSNVHLNARNTLIMDEHSVALTDDQ